MEVLAFGVELEIEWEIATANRGEVVDLGQDVDCSDCEQDNLKWGVLNRRTDGVG